MLICEVRAIVLLKEMYTITGMPRVEWLVMNTFEQGVGELRA